MEEESVGGPCCHCFCSTATQVPHQSLQPADATFEAAQAHAEAQRGQPSSNREKTRLAHGGRPIGSLKANSTQLQKQHLLLRQTQQVRQRSQQVSQQLSQQLPRQLQQQASSQLSEQQAKNEQAKQKKDFGHKRKLERAFGEVRNGEQTPDQADIMAEEDEHDKRQRTLAQEQASINSKPQMHKDSVQCKAADICSLSWAKRVLGCDVLHCAALCCVCDTSAQISSSACISRCLHHWQVMTSQSKQHIASSALLLTAQIWCNAQDEAQAQEQLDPTSAASQQVATADMANPRIGKRRKPSRKKYDKKRRRARYALVKQILAQHSGLRPVSAQPSAAAAAAADAACSSAPETATQPAAAAASNPVPATTSAAAPVPAAQSPQELGAEAAEEAAAEPAVVAASQGVAHQTAAPCSLPEEAAKRVPPARRRYRQRRDAKRRQQAREAAEAGDACLVMTSSRRRREKRKQRMAEKAAEAALDPAAQVSGGDNHDQKRLRVAGAAVGQIADSAMVRVLHS